MLGPLRPTLTTRTQGTSSVARANGASTRMDIRAKAQATWTRKSSVLLTRALFLLPGTRLATAKTRCMILLSQNLVPSILSHRNLRRCAAAATSLFTDASAAQVETLASHLLVDAQPDVSSLTLTTGWNSELAILLRLLATSQRAIFKSWNEKENKKYFWQKD